jgi:hypothetical protein
VIQFIQTVPVAYIDANNDGRWDDDANLDGVPDPADQNNDGLIDEDAAEKTYLLSLVDPGELVLVQFSHRGDWYRCQRNGNVLEFVGAIQGGVVPPGWNLLPPRTWPGVPPGYLDEPKHPESYTLLRSPRRVGAAMEFTGGTCIDLSYCGVGPVGTELAAAQSNVVVLFSASGGIDSLFIDGLGTQPMGALHLLVGSVTKIKPSSAGQWSVLDESNLADPTALWVSIGAKSGTVTTEDNMPDATATANLPAYLRAARQAAIARGQRGG